MLHAGIVEKEKEKVEKYQDLRREVARLWNVKAKVVPIVVGALGAVTPNLSKHLDASFYRKELSSAQCASSDGY